MLREGTPYAVGLPECCEANFDGRCDVAIHRGVGIDEDAQITHGKNRQHRGVVYTDSSGRDEMLTKRRRAPEQFYLRGVEQQPMFLIHDDTSSTQVDTLPQRLSTADG